MANLMFFFTVIMLMLNGILYKGVDSFYLLTILVGGYLLYSKAIKLSWELKRFYLFGVFFLLVVSTSVLRTDWHGFFEWRFSAFELLLFIPFIAAFSAFHFKSEDTFWKVLISSGLFTSFWLVMIVWNWPVPRGIGFLSDAINRGNMGMLHALISLVSFFAIQNRSWKFLAFIGFVCGVALSIISGSRGGWLALVISIFTLTLVFYKFSKLQEFKALVIAQLALVLVVVIFWNQLPIEQRILAAVDNINLYFEGIVTTSVGYRFELWKAAYYAFLEKPLLGWGWGQFNNAHSFVMENGYVAETRLFGHPHSQYFLFLAELGILGVIVFMAFITWPFIVAIRFIRHNKVFKSQIYLAILVIVLTESVLEFSLTDDSFSQKYFIFVFLFIISFALLKLQSKKVK